MSNVKPLNRDLNKHIVRISERRWIKRGIFSPAINKVRELKREYEKKMIK